LAALAGCIVRLPPLLASVTKELDVEVELDVKAEVEVEVIEEKEDSETEENVWLDELLSVLDELLSVLDELLSVLDELLSVLDEEKLEWLVTVDSAADETDTIALASCSDMVGPRSLTPVPRAVRSTAALKGRNERRETR
jgi:hypothetical protein